MGQVVEESHRGPLPFNAPIGEASSPGLSADELLTKLVKESPRAEVKLAGVPAMCILDTGAETSLMSATFYQEHLADKMTGMKPLGTYLEVFGVGGLEVPIAGYVEVPLTVFNKTVEANFLVVKDSRDGGLLNRRNSPLILGCNVLEMLKGVVVEQGQCDSEAWNVTLQWYGLTKGKGKETTQGQQNGCAGQVAVRTGRHEVTVRPRQAMTVNCYVRAPVHVFRNKVVIVEPDGSSSLSAAGKVYHSCGVTNGKTIGVLVANLGTQSWVIPPYTKLASLLEASVSDCIELHQTPLGVQVSVNHVLVENTGCLDEDSSKSSDTAELGSELRAEGEEFTFPDGSKYRLPPGLSLESCSLDQEEKEQVVRLVQKHDQVFSKSQFDVGYCDRIPHRINTVDNQAINEPYRRISPHCVQEVKTLLQGLLNQGIIRPSESPYASAVVLVKKRDGGLRLCVDYRKLNAKTIRDAFPLPRIEESLEALQGAKYFSAIDLAHGYHQVAMDPVSVEKTAFRVPFGLYEFTRMPFGLANAPGTFQRVMEQCLGDMNLSELLIYLDDILVYSSTVEEHLQRLDKVFTKLRDFGLKIKGKKCSLFRCEVNYLGHVINAQGIGVDRDKIQRIQDWPVPKGSEELRSFLGLASYYRRFVKGFATIAAPLHALLPPVKKGKPRAVAGIAWNANAHAAFEELKQVLVQAPVLVYPDFRRPFVLEVDASLKGLGACLAQRDQEGRLHPVAYASRGLRGAESKYPDYSSFKLELLGLKWAVVDKFRDYLIGGTFTVLTDNNPLSHLKTAKLGASEMRWAAQLAAFNLDIEYRSGASNRCADALSRHPGNCSSEVIAGILQTRTHSTSVPLHVGACNADCTPEKDGPTRAGPPGVFPSWSSEQLAALQKSDPCLSVVWERWDQRWVPGEVIPGGKEDTPELKKWLWQWSRFTERDGVLCRSVDDPVVGEVFQILVPESVRSRAVEGCHEGWGHQGVTRTCSLLRRRVYWPRMEADVRAHIRKCERCVKAKVSEPMPKVPMRHLLAFRPLEVLAIDFVKIDRGRGGYEDILVMTDVYTKYVQAVPCRDQSAETVAKVLRDSWFTKFGIPNRIHSDQGRNFEGVLIRELCALYGIKKSRTTPYHPEGNAQAERFNRTLFGLIKSFSESERRRWPDFLSHLTFVYNSTPHCTTGVAPYTLMFGREPLIPLDQILGRSDSNWGQDFVREQSELLERAGALVKERVRKRTLQNEALHHNVNAVPLQVGSQVLLKKCAFKGRHKLKDAYDRKPYVVTWKNAHDDVYRIRPLDGGPEKTVNRKYLRLDPLAESDSGSELSDESEFDVIITKTAPSGVTLEQSVGSEKVGEPLVASGRDPVLPQRRSLRRDKGIHSNPHRLPRSVVK